MLFHVRWTVASPSEESNARSLQVFSAWKPPAGADFKGFYGTPDGGGVAIIEVDSLATLARTTSPWTAWFDFETTPLLPIEESAAIGAESVAWLASVR